MKKRICLFLLLFVILQASMAQKKPNVLFIAIDDLNDYVSCMGGSISIPTPNLDRLVAKSTLFTNAHCQAPICGPSRASILSGLSPTTSGNYLQINDSDIKKSNQASNKIIFLPDYFENYGYKTMGVGKIFHNGDGAGVFDEYGPKSAWMGPKPDKRFHYDPVKIKPDIEMTQTDWGAFPAEDSLMTDYISAHWAIDKIHQKHEKPFFLALGFVRPHVPWYAPQKWFDLFPKDQIQTPPYLKNDTEDVPPMGLRVADAPMMPTTEMLLKTGEWKDVIQAYMACVAFVDAQLGKVLDALEQSPYAANTIIVLWADHGYHLGEKNRFAKQALWERDTRSILLFKDPQNPKAQTIKEPVQLLDIYPTLLDLCDLKPNINNEGHSLRGLINGSQEQWPHAALSFYGMGNIAVRTKDYRLIQYEDGSMEFYDMQKDPNEWKNLAHKKKMQHKIAQHQAFIPNSWAINSTYSKYKFNEYFIEKSK